MTGEDKVFFNIKCIRCLYVLYPSLNSDKKFTFSINIDTGVEIMPSDQPTNIFPRVII